MFLIPPDVELNGGCLGDAEAILPKVTKLVQAIDWLRRDLTRVCAVIRQGGWSAPAGDS